MALTWQSYEYSLLLAEAGTTDAVFLTWDPVLSRVRVDAAVAATIDGSPAPAGATRVIERSTDLAHWSVIRGGTEDDVDAAAVPVDDYEFAANVQNHYRITVRVGGELFWTFRDAVTTSLETTWLKFPTQPFLNRTVVVADFGDVTQPARGGTFAVVGRSRAVAVTDVRGGDQYELSLLVDTMAAADELKLCLSGGQVVLIQGPGDSPVPAGYYWVADVARARPFRRGERRVFTLPLTEVVAPDGSLRATSITWRGLANRYATWADVIADNATWRDVLELRGTPQDVIVP